MKLGDFLTTLARKSNMSEDKALVDILSNSTLANTEIADSFANTLDGALMSLEGAKNNAAVLNHFKPIILKAADDKFAILAEKYGFSEEAQAEKSTYKKFDILESKLEAKIAEIEKKQIKTNNQEKEAELTKQLTDLQKQLATLSEAKTTEIAGVKSGYEAQITDMYVKSVLQGKRYATKDLPVDVNIRLARQIIDDKLQKQGAVLIRENGELKLKQSANPEMDYVDAGFKPVSFSDFTDTVLAENKLLDVSNSQDRQQTPQPIQRVATSNYNDTKFRQAVAEAQGGVE